MAKVSYEWTIEEVDEFGDIGNVDHADTFCEAVRRKADIEQHGGGMEKPDHVDVALLRLEYDDIDGELARHYAYLRPDLTLPECMESCTGANDGPSVPKRFHAETAKCAVPA